MLPLDTLHTIAEVGIAITGFAGIVVAIRSGSGRWAEPSFTDPLGVLFVASLGTVFFCFVPEWLNSAIAAPDTVWRLSLAAFGTYRLVYIALIFSSQRRAGMLDLSSWRFLIGLAIGVFQLIAAAGFLGQLQYFLYLSGLLWGLVVALICFYSLLRGPAQE